MNRNVEVSCPYCGHRENVKLTSDYGEILPVLCDVMTGGCDSFYMVRSTVGITTKALKIEGEGGRS